MSSAHILSISPTQLGIVAPITRCKIEIRRSYLVDTFVVIPDFNKIINPMGADFSCRLLSNTYGSFYEITLWNGSTEELRCFFVMPEAAVNLHDLELLTSYPPPVIGDAVQQTFLSLADTPNAYSGQGGKVVAVKQDESGLEFIECSCDGGESSFCISNGSLTIRTTSSYNDAQNPVAWLKKTNLVTGDISFNKISVNLDEAKWSDGSIKKYLIDNQILSQINTYFNVSSLPDYYEQSPSYCVDDRRIYNSEIYLADAEAILNLDSPSFISSSGTYKLRVSINDGYYIELSYNYEPISGNWQAVRAAILAYFADALTGMGIDSEVLSTGGIYSDSFGPYVKINNTEQNIRLLYKRMFQSSEYGFAENDPRIFTSGEVFGGGSASLHFEHCTLGVIDEDDLDLARTISGYQQENNPDFELFPHTIQFVIAEESSTGLLSGEVDWVQDQFGGNSDIVKTCGRLNIEA